MYFPDGNYLEHFHSMVVGYWLGARVNGTADPLALGQDFAKWLVEKKRFGGGISRGWVGVLLRKYPDDSEAYDRFFDLLAEYRGWPPITLVPIDPNPGSP